MNNSLISIIVAIYKVEEYLPKCIESILNQAYKNIELILVNDGSPDNSLEICNEYVIKDARVRVINKDNGGQATARNKALDIANGDYIGFVDGDDWIEIEMYQLLYNTMVAENADIVQCGWYKVESSLQKKCPYKEHFKEIYTSDEGLLELIKSQGKHLNTSVCCKLFKKEIIQSIRFSPVRAYEDDEFLFKAVSIAKKIVCIDTPLYNYLNRDNSTMTANFNLNKIALVTIQKNICDIIKVRFPQYFNYMQKVLCSKQFYILNCLIINCYLDKDSAYANELETSIMKSYSEYMVNPEMKYNKLMLVLIKYTPRIIWSKILRLKFS
ncbi:glycosyltransferase family 2 protein [Parabacteroides goldsteinii]|uniref:glycosyltransferase family 2 protein n=1 Tax=Parabacteroides goldsteinii TaxID=328812 RepID=UPI00101D0572|nr:glycosyltransferase family 2 protein [Parabacteroides goldsteinii]